MWEQIQANKRRSIILIILMAALLFVVGFALGEVIQPGMGVFGLFIAAVVWLIMTLVSYFQGDRIFLRISGARKIRKSDHPMLFNVVEEMKIASGLPHMPDIYIIDDPALNAFATGRKPENAAVAVTAGLLERLNRDELQGVIAHEMAHIHNRDVLYMTMVAIMLGAIVWMADIGLRRLFWGGSRRRTSGGQGGQLQIILLVVGLLVIVLAPILAHLIYYAISRKREYLADACAAQFTRYPEGLARALEKIGISPIKLRSATRATAPMYIANPFKIGKSFLNEVTSTHPPVAERIKILRAMGGGAGYVEYDRAYRQVHPKSSSVLPSSVLQAPALAAVAVTPPPRTDDRSDVDRVRQTTDALWHTNDYIFIDCDCQTRLKIPPKYRGKTIECPHCMTPHPVLEAP